LVTVATILKIELWTLRMLIQLTNERDTALPVKQMMCRSKIEVRKASCVFECLLFMSGAFNQPHPPTVAIVQSL